MSAATPLAGARRHILPRLPLAIALIAAFSASPLAAKDRTSVTPYLGVDQTVVTDLSGGTGRTDAYTSLVAGLNAQIEGRNSEAQVDLLYQHQFAWTNGTPDNDVISGVARGRFDLIPKQLRIEAGGLATRTSTDGFSGANGNLLSAGSTANVYSAYIQPTYQSHWGGLAVNAAYRFGYNKLDVGNDRIALGSRILNLFDESTTHLATASIGARPGDLLPFGWTVSGGYAREDASQLDQRFEDGWGRFDVTVPITYDIALVGGVGYEAIRISNRDAARDGTGLPIAGRNGRFFTDPNSPRTLSYDSSELIWDAGILWKPSDRTSLEARVGHRYGSESYTGSFNWKPGSHTAIAINVFDSVTSFGRSLSGGLASLPTDLSVGRNPFTGDIGNCTFGADASGGGACFNDTLASIRTANYRNRGVVGSYVFSTAQWNFGAAVGYSRRKFLGDNAIYAGINGAADEDYYGSLTAGYAFNQLSGININVYANQFNSGIAGILDTFNAGGYATYHRTFARRIQANASIGVDSRKQSGVEAVLTGLAQIGLRYQF